MFKSLTLLKSNITAIKDGDFQYLQFSPCEGQQEKALGWVPPRGHEHGAMVEFVGGEAILRLRIETKSVPAAVIKRKLDEKAEETFASTGRKPGKKERRDMAEDIRAALLPNAFSKVVEIPVWVDTHRGRLAIGSASVGHVDSVFTMLIQAMPSASFQPFTSQVSPESLMTSWLHDQDNLSTEDRFGFDIDRECELKAIDETHAVVKYTKHTLELDEIRTHIKQGKTVTKLALTYNDRVSFVLTPTGQMRKIKILDVAFEGHEGEDNFDADVAIFTGEFDNLINSLHGALDVQEDEL